MTYFNYSVILGTWKKHDQPITERRPLQWQRITTQAATISQQEVWLSFLLFVYNIFHAPHEIWLSWITGIFCPFQRRIQGKISSASMHTEALFWRHLIVAQYLRNHIGQETAKEIRIMETIKGAYTSAQIFTTNNKETAIDPYAIAQLQMICDQESTRNRTPSSGNRFPPALPFAPLPIALQRTLTLTS